MEEQLLQEKKLSVSEKNQRGFNQRPLCHRIRLPEKLITDSESSEHGGIRTELEFARSSCATLPPQVYSQKFLALNVSSCCGVVVECKTITQETPARDCNKESSTSHVDQFVFHF